MRSSKYHDFRAVKIILSLIILVVLGLFVYVKCIKTSFDHVASGNKWEIVEAATCTTDGTRCKICDECGQEFDHETIPATGHRPAAAVKENEVTPTCTEGGSYESVVYCKDCGVELSKETVQVDSVPHNTAKVVKDVIDPTHTVAGSYMHVTECVDCGEELSSEKKITDPIGHNYSDWKLVYEEATRTFILVGSCSCSEEGNTLFVTEADGLTVKVDDAQPSCIAKTYIVTYKYNGKTIRLTHQVEPDSHAFFEIILEGVGVVYLSLDSRAMYDEVYGTYYDIDNEGIYLVVDEEGKDLVDQIWNSDGFAIGVFKCPRCEEWYGIRVYSAEYDTRLSSN